MLKKLLLYSLLTLNLSNILSMNQNQSLIRQKETTACNICRDELKNKDIVRLHCHKNHLFCLSCINSWFIRIRHDIRCPICQTQIQAYDKETLQKLKAYKVDQAKLNLEQIQAQFNQASKTTNNTDRMIMLTFLFAMFYCSYLFQENIIDIFNYVSSNLNANNYTKQ